MLQSYHILWDKRKEKTSKEKKIQEEEESENLPAVPVHKGQSYRVKTLHHDKEQSGLNIRKYIFFSVS